MLGQRDELVRRQPAVHGVRPAQQHLGARHRIGAQVDLGLVVQHELLALERRAQVAGQGQALHAVAVELGDVALDPGAPLLGLVHGDVGALHEHVDVLAVLGEGRDADAGAELQAHAGDVEVLGDGAPDGGRDGDAGGRRLDRAQEDRELVAAEARDGVVLAQQAREALADLAQHLVAVVVAEGVVDLLEAIEVEQHHRDAGPGAPGARDRVLGARAEEDAVGQTGQRVVQGEALGDERLAAGALDGDHGQGQQRQQHRRRVEREDGERREAQQDALGGRLADELGGDLVAQAGAGRHRDGTGHEAGVDDEEDERGGEDGRARRRR